MQTVISEIAGGSYKWSQVRWFGLADNCVDIAENENYLANISAEDQKKIQEIKKRIVSGEIVVPTAYGMDAETLKTYN